MGRVAAVVLGVILTLAAVVPADEVTVLERIDPKLGFGVAVFAPTGDRVGRMLNARDTGFVVVNGKVDPEFESVDGLVFSRDGKHYAYRAREGAGKWCVVVDGKAQKSYAWVGPPALSSDGSKAAYWATRNGGEPGLVRAGGDYFVVFGQKEGKSYSGQAIRSVAPAISPNGKNVAYAAPKAMGIWHVVVGSKVVGKGYSGVEDPVFSADGRDFVYAAVVRGRRWAVVNSRGKTSDLYDAASTPVFGKGRKYAFIAREDGSWFVVLGKKRFKGDYALINKLVVSPDGKRVGFTANVGGHFQGMSGGGPMRANPGVMIEGGRWHVVVDGKSLCDSESVEGPVFGPRSKRVAYGVQRGLGQWQVVCGERKSDHYLEVSGIAFSPDGKSVRFGARCAKGYVRVVMPL